MSGGAERQIGIQGKDTRLGKVARSIALAGTLGATAVFGACGEDSKTPTPIVESTHTVTVEPTQTTYPTIVDTRIPTAIETPQIIETPTVSPTPEVTDVPQVEVNQQNFWKYLDPTNPDRFQLVQGDGVNKPLRVIGGLNKNGWDVIDTTTGERISDPARFLEVVGPSNTEIKALAVLTTIEEAIPSKSEMEAENDYARSYGVDISSQLSETFEIHPDYFEITVPLFNRHSCVGRDSQGREVYASDLITVKTFRVYQAYLPTTPPSLPPDVKDSPVVSVSETQSLPPFPEPTCIATE